MLNSILGFFTGVGIFIYGANLLSKGMQQLALSKLRVYMTKFTNTHIKGLISGFIMTCFMQSNTVTSIIVVGLVGSSVFTLSQALAVILGSGIGTTVIVQILTFDISKYSAFFIFSGVILVLFFKKTQLKTLGQILTGFGFVLFGIGFITTSLEPLNENQGFLDMISALSQYPILFVIVSALITALLHNSAAMILIGISFVVNDAITLAEVIPIILGANIGATIPVLISSLSFSAEGKRVAFSYMVFKTAGAAICLLMLPWLNEWIHLLPGDIKREAANFHTIFNLGIAALFLPMLSLVTPIANRLFQGKKPEIALRLNETLLSVPDEALIKAKSEILQLAYNIKDGMIAFLPRYIDDESNFESIYSVEKEIDESYEIIQKYLLKLGQQNLSDSQSDLEVKLLYILNDIESIGDNIVQFLNLIQKSRQNNIQINNQDHEFLETFIAHIDEALVNSIQALEWDDLDVAMKNIQMKPSTSQLEMDLKFNHFNRLIDKNEYDPVISATYLDIANQLTQVYRHVINISRTVLGLI